ncbi:hypothetical protein PN836_015260 [Ningiella sp. W23]|uniref:hypothetical protein n=1 Tax=Ningiella sp. W23 TaxID=3023715 RepID=UPI003756D5B7
MKLLFTRNETPEKVVIVFKPYSMYVLLVVLLMLMAVSFIDALASYEYLANYLMPVAALVVVARIIFMHKVNKEIQQAIRDERVEISGGKLSAKNPLTFVIIKLKAQET